MKKRSINVGIILLAVIAVFCFIEAGQRLRDVYDTKYARYSCNLSLEKDGDISSKRISDTKKQLQFIPESIQKDFLRSEWKIVVTDEDLDKKYFDGKYDNVNGVTVSQEGTIYLKDSYLGSHIAPVHEMGHWFDIQNNLMSKTEEFLNIYHTEKRNLKKEFAADVSNEMEFFAEGFQAFLKYPERTKKKTPMLHEYMSNIIWS